LLLSTALLALHPQAHWQPGMAVDKTIALSQGGAQ
jgi:hypothetical protein